MSQSKLSTVSTCSLNFLEQNPGLSNFLFADCNFNLSEVATIIEPVLQAEKRCQVTPFYVQAVTTGRTTFLTTNLCPDQALQATGISSNWLIGRSSACAITVSNPLVSRRHAAICYQAGQFYATDIGSSNGTWVNQRRLVRMERQPLQDGDLLRLGGISAEFFIVSYDSPQMPHVDPSPETFDDPTCF
jgi:hypothetical protein